MPERQAGPGAADPAHHHRAWHPGAPCALPACLCCSCSNRPDLTQSCCGSPLSPALLLRFGVEDAVGGLDDALASPSSRRATPQAPCGQAWRLQAPSVPAQLPCKAHVIKPCSPANHPAALMSTPQAPCCQPWQLQNRTLRCSHRARHPRVPWMLLKARPNMRQPSSAQLEWGCISALPCHTPTGSSFDAINATHPTDSRHNTAACSPNPDQNLGLSCACGAANPGVRGGGAADGLLLT